MNSILPQGWPRPRGFSNATELVCRPGDRTLFLAGQIGWTPDGVFEAQDFVGQLRQTLQNIVDIIDAAGGEAAHITRMTWFITDKAEYRGALADIGAIYREVMGNHYPAMSVVEVSALIEDDARLEIEATAVIPVAAV